jgi:hypothetical protein
MSRREAVQRPQNEPEETTLPAPSSPANAAAFQNSDFNFGNIKVFPEAQTSARETMPFDMPPSLNMVAHEAAHVTQQHFDPDPTRRKPRD